MYEERFTERHKQGLLKFTGDNAGLLYTNERKEIEHTEEGDREVWVYDVYEVADSRTPALWHRSRGGFTFFVLEYLRRHFHTLVVEHADAVFVNRERDHALDVKVLTVPNGNRCAFAERGCALHPHAGRSSEPPHTDHHWRGDFPRHL